MADKSPALEPVTARHADLPRVIGLYSRNARMGKSTTAKYLRDRYNYHIVPFAGPLKQCLVNLLMASGFLKQDAEQYVYGDLRNSKLPLFECDYRRMAQTLGTEWGRELIHPDIWVRLWRRQVDELLAAGKNVVADDMRFPNEIEVVHHLGVSIEVQDPRIADAPPLRPWWKFWAGPRYHPSEGKLTGQCDLKILNYKGIPELHHDVDEFISLWQESVRV